jgi:hypothetical protein
MPVFSLIISLSLFVMISPLLLFPISYHRMSTNEYFLCQSFVEKSYSIEFLVRISTQVYRILKHKKS